MLAFLDTEFTDLVVWPRLLSVGLVVDGPDDRAFYAEVTDPDRLRATGWFGQGAVLPQFGKVPDAACTSAELGLRLLAFLDGLATGLAADACVELAYGHHLDWELLDRAVQDADAGRWASVRRRIRPVNVYERTGFDAGHLAAEAYFRTQADAPYSRHHALCDARALRLAYATSCATQPRDRTAVLLAPLPSLLSR